MAGPTGTDTGRTPSPARQPATRRAAPAAAPAAGGAQQTIVAREPAPAAVAPITAPQPAPAPQRESLAMLYGLIVVVAGFVAILIGLYLVVVNYKTATDATAILGIITTAIAGLGGAFFGVAIGQQGTASANKERNAAEAAKDEANMRSIKFAANMDPAVARRLVD